MKQPPISLDQLIELVRAQHPDGDALERLTDAMSLSTYLSEQADHLIGHFVDQARANGASWSQIGAAMGVTKQAAQQRWVPRWTPDLMGRTFSRFTDRARNVLTHANRLAAGNGAGTIGAEHVLLGLFSEPEGVAAKVLADLRVTRAAVAEAVGISGPPADEVAMLGFGDADKTMLDRTLGEALKLGHNYVGTEHILLGILASDLPVVATLAELGVTTETVTGPIKTLIAELTWRKPPS
jgi:hypothetical protein